MIEFIMIAFMTSFQRKQLKMQIVYGWNKMPSQQKVL